MDGKKIIIIAVGILALTGVSLGVFAFTKSRKLKKQNEEDDANTGGGGSTTTGGGNTTTTGGGNTTTTGGGNTTTQEQPTQQVDVNYNQPEPPASSTPSGENPFATKDELKAFQKWVFDVKKENIGNSTTPTDGLWGKKGREAWAKYGTEYTAFLNPTQTTTTTTTTTQQEWSSANWESGKEMYDYLKQSGHSVNLENGAFSLNMSGGNTNTVIFKFYYDGQMTIEKKGGYASGYYAKQTGRWAKITNGFRYEIGGKTYNAQLSGSSIKDTCFTIAKDLNYYQWSDGKFVPMVKEYDDFLNMTEDKNKQRRIELQF
jgi:hypothetical protein